MLSFETACLRQRAPSLNCQTTINILPKVYGTRHVKPSFWKQLLNSPSVSMFDYQMKINARLLLFFLVLDEFKVDIMFALLASSTFFPHLSAPYVSFLTQVTLSAVHTSSVTNVFTFTISLLCFSHIYTQTHTHTPLVGISATLLTGANQSYNTFIISTPPQVPSCWVKSHLGLFECFTALEICNYIMDMGGPGLAGSSHWQLDTKQTRCEQNSTPQKKKKKKNKMKKGTKTTVYDQRLAVVMLHSFLGPSLFNLHKLQNGKLACGSKRSHFKLGGKAVEFQGFQKNKCWSSQTLIAV